MTTVDRLFWALKFCSALGCGLVAGVFFAFSTFVMNALARLQPAQGIAATRLRVRSVFYLPQFAWYTLKSKKQAESASGIFGGRLMLEARWVFWTMTAWESEAAMRAYRSSGAHMKAMPKLLDWCDEASYVHWEQENKELPSWAEAHRRMVAEGKLSKVKNPSAAQLAKKIAEPQRGGSEGQRLKPVVKS